MSRFATWIPLIIGSIATVCLAYSAVRQAPVSDEFGHFYAGLRYWQASDLTTFNVNPPLVRGAVTLPGYLAGMRADPPTGASSDSRPEFVIGRRLFIFNPDRFQFYLTIGRCFVGVLTLLGAALLYYWGKSLAGPVAGTVASCLWMTQPQILSHGVLITGDVVCAVCMSAALYLLAWMFKDLTVVRAATFASVLAIAILAKFTAMVLLPVYIVALAWHADRYSLRRLAGSLVVVGVTLLPILAAPYRFEGCGKGLFDYRFLSQRFNELQQQAQNLSRRLPAIPAYCWATPLPEQFVLGMDRQQLDFERGLPSYAAGYRASHGWWWFYLYSMLVKLPLGTWLAICAAAALLLRGGKGIRQDLGLPLLTLMAMVVTTCLQSGFAQQHRYILPAYPFLFLVVGVVASRARLDGVRSLRLVSVKRLSDAVYLGVLLTLTGSLTVAPHWLSAFNWLAGGNRSGFTCLFNDASDWGQDTYRVRDWINLHQGSVPIYVRSTLSGYPELEAVGARDFVPLAEMVTNLPRPCWLLVSKTDYVVNPSLRQQLDPLPLTEAVAGTHRAYYLDSGTGLD